MARTNPNPTGYTPGCQLPLWAQCGVCGGPHYGLGVDMFGRHREHARCAEAIDRWIVYRTGPLPEEWVAAVDRCEEPNRSVL